MKLEREDGTSIRFGFLWQGQYEARGDAHVEGYSQNLYLRHVSILLGGAILGRFEYFFETDFADLFKATAGDRPLKNGPGITTTDAFVTFEAVSDALMIDAGLLLPPGAHNSLQSKATLLGWDYFMNTARHGSAFGSTSNAAARDVGVGLRGLVFEGVIEYRAGIFQGKRDAPDPGPPPGVASRNPFRFAARVQLNLLDPEVGYFYTGTSLGRRKTLSAGAAVDYQRDGDRAYRAYAADAFLDAANVTAQVDVVYRNGGALVPLPEQTAVMAELGYRIEFLKLSPILRYERRFQPRDSESEVDFAGGLAFWAFGHTSNLKAFYTRLVPEQGAYDQFNAQWQAFFY